MKTLKIIGSLIVIALVTGIVHNYIKLKQEREKYFNLYGSDEIEENRINYYVDKELGHTDEDIQTKSLLKAIIKDLNAQCPIDYGTNQLNKVSAINFPGNFTLLYHFIVKDRSYDEIDWNELRQEQQKNISNLYHTSDDFKTFRDRNISLQYLFYDKNENIGTIVMIP